ncbi:MAG: hypothetical protein U5L74_07895 [Ideonella sp.]|nr:hypothetical protein [Ideonella sp.]
MNQDTSAIRLRQATLDDHAAIQALFRQNTWPLRSLAAWDWAFEQNPSRQAIAAPLGWVLTKGDDIGGFIGNLPQTYWFQGQRVMTATCTSYLVRPEWRARSVDLLRAFFVQPHVQCVFTTTANEHSAQLYKLFKAKPWTPQGTDQRLLWIASDNALVQHSLRRLHQHLLLGQAGTPLAWVLRPLRRWVGIATVPKARGFAGHALTITADSAEQLDLRFERFWQGLKQRAGMQLDRSPEMLAWRLGDPDMRGHCALLSLLDAAGEVLGMAQVLAVTNRPHRIPRVQVLDWVLRDSPPQAARNALLQAVSAWAQARDLPLIEAARFSGAAFEQLRKAQPHQCTLHTGSHWVRLSANALHADQISPPSWPMTNVDGDDWFGVTDYEAHTEGDVQS